jgi:putative endonuclease
MQLSMARKQTVPSSSVHAGVTAYHAGIASEISVARHYERSGFTICAQRWRGTGGEIDLVAKEGDVLVFIEVKQSRTFALAAQHLTDRQMKRIYRSASEYLAQEPAGLDTNVRFDVALVDFLGQIEIIEQAFMA